MSENAVAKAPAIDLAALQIGELVWKGLAPTQQGWIVLGHKKGLVFAELQRMELGVQATLKDVLNEKDLTKVQAALTKAKAELAELKDCRLQFSRMLEERLLAPSMDFEKRTAALLEPVTAHELNLRLEANKKASEEAAKTREVNAFKAHITNEYFRIATEYRNMLENEIQTAYINALNQGLQADYIPKYVQDLQAIIPTLALPKFAKFERTLIPDAEAKTIFQEIKPYNAAPDMQKAIERVKEVFSMYAQDQKNAAAAAEEAKKELENTVATNNDALQLETATNTLMAQAEPLVMTGGSKTNVKTKLVVVVENSEAWTLAIIAAALKNWQKIKIHFRVKNWEKLSIGQLADALGKLATETGEQYTGLKLKEDVK